MPEQRTKNYYYKFLAKNISWLFFGRVISKIFTFLTLPIITLYLSPEQYGIIALFFVESAFLAGLCDFGIISFSGRMIYKFDRRNKKTCRQYIGVIFFYMIIFSFVNILFVAPFVKVLANFMLKGVDIPYDYLYYIPLVYAFFLKIYGFSTGCFLQLQHNKKLFLCEFVESLFILPSQIIGLIWFHFTWVEIVLLQLIGKIISSVYSLWLLRGDMGFSLKRLRIIKQALQYSLPMIPIQFSGFFQEHINKIFLVNMSNAASVGIYAMGYKLSEAFSFFSRPIMTTIKPEVVKRLDGKNKNIQNDLSEIFKIFFQVSLFVIFIASIFSSEVVHVFLNARYANALFVISFLMFAYLFGELTGIFNLKFMYKNKTAYYSLVTFFGVICNTLFNYFLIKHFNYIGAAGASMLSAFSVLLLTYGFSQKLHHSNYGLWRNFIVLSFVGILIYVMQKKFMVSALGFTIKVGITLIYALILFKVLSSSSGRFRELQRFVLNKLRRKPKIV